MARRQSRGKGWFLLSFLFACSFVWFSSFSGRPSSGKLCWVPLLIEGCLPFGQSGRKNIKDWKFSRLNFLVRSVSYQIEVLRYSELQVRRRKGMLFRIESSWKPVINFRKLPTKALSVQSWRFVLSSNLWPLFALLGAGLVIGSESHQPRRSFKILFHL